MKNAFTHRAFRLSLPATRSRRPWLVLQILLVVGCDSLGPAPQTIEPSVVVAGADTSATIVGEHFLNEVNASLGREPATIRRDWSVEFGSVNATDVVRVDSQTIELTIPGVLEPGEYTVVLVAPSGERAPLPELLRVEGGGPRVVIENAPDGTGVPIDAMTLLPGDGFDVFAVVREGGAFVEAAVVDWSVVGGIGTVGPGPSSSSRFVASTPGQGRVVASHSTGEAQTGLLTVEGTAGLLEATLSAPAEVSRGGSFEVVLEVQNVGDQDLMGVRPCALDAPRGTSSLLDVDSQPLNVGGFAAFRWEAKSSVLGTLELSTCATGVPIGGSSLALSNIARASVVVREPPDSRVTEIAVDPFGDGAAHAFVNGYRGDLLLGPSADGTRALRVTGDGTQTLLTMSFTKDRVLSSSRNASADPYPSIGFTGCEVDTPECGPDNEDGRGLMRTVTLGGTEWIVLGGARSGGELKYVYMSSAEGPDLEFYYVSLDLFTGGQTEAVSAIHALGDDLYLGFVDSGGRRPYLLSVRDTPTAPGLDVIVQGVNHRADQLAGISPGPTSMIDVIWDFAERPYIANAGAWYRSRVARPAIDSSVWVDVTPIDPAYAAVDSEPSGRTADLNPADRAVPQSAIFGGRLYVARNTMAGPQLFVCDPARTDEAEQCDAGDWSLIAPNTAGEATLTQFNDRRRLALSMLVATERSLFVGFDTADGVEVFRSERPDPRAPSDFSGEAGCIVGEPACEGIGRRGFGQAAHRLIFDAQVLELGGSAAVVVTTGNGTTPVRVVRID